MKATDALLALVLLSGVTFSLACQQTQAQGLEAGREALRVGQYDQAITILSALVRSASATPSDRLALARAYRETGKYAEAGRLLESIEAAPPEWFAVRGELAELQGELDRAERLYRNGVASGGSAATQSGARLGRLLLSRGRQDEARDQLATALRSGGDARASHDLEALGIVMETLGSGWGDPSRFQDALRFYDRAVAADSTNTAAQIALGHLFLAKYNRPEARATFDAVLRVNPNHPEALVGQALVAHAEGRGEAATLLERALSVNPNLVPARVAVATGHLEQEDYPAAEEAAAEALGINPVSLPALTVLGAAHWLAGNRAAYDTVEKRVLRLNPRHADFYAQMAVLNARNRFYHEAVTFAAKGVALDSLSATALGALGLNELRIGAMSEGRAHLESAFALDPFNVWTKNTLDLLDTFARYEMLETDTVRVIAAPDELGLLGPYLRELGEAGFRAMMERFSYRPKMPIQLEVYRHHADFSVRTVGLAGLGALGVSFGTVLAMDSPSARSRGDFNWGSTFWHELAHTFTLGATAHRVPRWFSEGLSVLEERRARPGWGTGVRLGFLRAYREGKLHPVSRLNEGFVRPSYPDQVGHSYLQASLVCEMIEETRGASALTGMLDGYRRGLSGAEVFKAVLGSEPEAFDKEFERWFEKRYGEAADAVSGEGGGPFQQELERGLRARRAGEAEAARQAFERAKALFPEYAERDNPYWHLAQIHREAGRLRAAAGELARLTALAESDYDANLLEAEILDSLADSAGVARALERAVYIDPRDPALHARLAEVLGRLGRWDRAAREREAVLALDPVDRAEAYYQLALARFQAGDRVRARQAVLRALDIAPAYELAQDLLLRIRGESPRGGTSP